MAESSQRSFRLSLIKRLHMPHLAPKPSYYREEFNSPLSNFYDIMLKIITFGFENKLRKQIFKYFPENPQKILDLCCGTGSLTILSAQKYPEANLLGIDLSENMLKQARRKSQKLKIQYSLQNIENTNFENHCFDVITISFGLHEIPQDHYQNVIKEVKRLLKPAGQFIIHDYAQPKNFLLKIILTGFFKLFEPYGKNFLETNWEEKLKSADFKQVQTKNIFQLTRLIAAS